MRFLHTSDWQLGMTRHFFDAGTQEVFSQARFDVIARMADLAQKQNCAFAVVAGDVFETNQVDRRTVSRALDALGRFTIPVYLLPGNHDCYDPGSVYTTSRFLDRCPDHVQVLTDPSPRHPVDGVEVVGAAWTSKHPLDDLVSLVCQELEPDGRPRVVVGHGAIDAVIGGASDDPALIHLSKLEAAVEDGRVSYVALGDRHSCTQVGSTGAVWYSGTPEPTDYREEDPGTVLIVDLAGDGPAVERVEVGDWGFHVVEQEVTGDADLDALDDRLATIPDPARAVVKLKLTGALTLRQVARLEDIVDHRRDLFGVLEQPERHRDVVVRPDDGDFSDIPLSGYASVARDRLQDRAAGSGDEADTAADALALLLRLSKQET